MSDKEKGKYSIKEFFNKYLDYIGKFTLVNLIFAGIILVSVTLLFFVSSIAGEINLLILALIIPIMSPFIGGLFHIAKKLTLDEDLNPVKDFFAGIKPNFIPFFINSFFVYVITVGLYVTFQYYRAGFDSPLKIVSFVFTIIFTLFFFNFECSALTMLVCVDLRISEILRNAVILALGGIVNHIKTLLSLALMACIIFTGIRVANDPILGIFVFLLPFCLIIPALSVYIVVFNNWQTIERIVVDPYREEHKSELREKEQNKQLEQAAEESDPDELISLAQGDPEEFVYVGGRMIKRKNVLKMLEKTDKKAE